MSIAEASLYGDLVKYLRDQWAEQRAEWRGSSVEQERANIDDLIRTWLFTPQDEMYGFTPRNIIRNEQMDRPNVIPEDRLRDALGEDYELYEIAKQYEENPEFDFGLAPDRTLLDDYDEEGYEARWADGPQMDDFDDSEAFLQYMDKDIPFPFLEEEVPFSPIPKRVEREYPEARAWLLSNPNRSALAANRFMTTQAALDFVDELYALGAVSVKIDNILDDEKRVQTEGGPYADTLIVELPSGRGRKQLYDLFEYEMTEQHVPLDMYDHGNFLHFWWD